MTLIGISIAVPEPWGEMLRDRRRSYGDAAAETIPSHITLAPPLDVTGPVRERIRDALRDVASRHQPFGVALAGTDTFRPVSQVVYIAVSAGVPAIADLAHGVTSAIGSPEPEFGFHPHVTVVHDLADEVLDLAATDLADFGCEFEVREFWLYDFDADAGWIPRESFPLG